jgi:hypothetical protein
MAPQAFQSSEKFPAVQPVETSGGIQQHSGKGHSQ